MNKLSPRLTAVYNFVLGNSIIADVGCDHGLLTAHLVSDGKVCYAVASDINEKPLMACKKLITENDLNNKVDIILADGLQSPAFDKCNEIIICGMGGELISYILSAFSNLKRHNVHYVFNPMTHPEILRKFLCENGFVINRDIIVKEANHYYNVFDAFYTDSKTAFCETYYYLGNIVNFEYKEYFIHLIHYLQNKEKDSSTDRSAIIKAIKEKI